MDDFERLRKVAGKEARAESGQGKKQVIAALSAGGRLYCKAIGGSPEAEGESDAEGLSLSDLDSFLEELIQNQDTHLDKLVCLWVDGDVDVPSCDFRKRLCGLNSANRETGILLRTADGYLVKALSETLQRCHR